MNNHAEDLAKLGWQYFECPACGSEGARAFPKPAQQAPVAWMHVMDNTEGIKANGKGLVSITQKRKHPFGKPGIDFSKSYPVTSTPLYTTPPQRTWVGLTNKERADCWETVPELAMKKVEAKLKEKNT